jgi:HEAT repeat protein
MKGQLAQIRGAGGDEEQNRANEEEDARQERALATAALQDPDPEVRYRAVRPIWGFVGREAVDLLIEALEDPEAKVRSGAAHQLTQIRATEALPALIRHALGNEPLPVRYHYAMDLNEFDDPRATDALIQLLAEQDGTMLLIAAGGLCRSSHRDPRAIPALLPLLDHSCRDVRFQTAGLLLRLNAADWRLVAALEQLARDPEAEEYELSGCAE